VIITGWATRLTDANAITSYRALPRAPQDHLRAMADGPAGLSAGRRCQMRTPTLTLLGVGAMNSPPYAPAGLLGQKEL
jgi:hypothetical protein